MIIINNCVLIGRLTKDPELRHLQNGTGVANFTLAIDRGISKDKKMEMEQKGQPTAEFINITSWGKTAELVVNYLSKGRQVAIQGRIQTSSYEGQDGKRVYRTDVVADRVEFIGGNESNKTVDAGANYGFGDEMMPIISDDIPF